MQGSKETTRKGIRTPLLHMPEPQRTKGGHSEHGCPLSPSHTPSAVCQNHSLEPCLQSRASNLLPFVHLHSYTHARKRNPVHCWQSWHRHDGNQRGSSSNAGRELPDGPAIPLLGPEPRTPWPISEVPAHPCSLLLCQPSYSLADKWMRKCGILFSWKEK